MNALQPFAFAGQQVRVVVGTDGEPWFVAADVARILGYREAEKMTRLMDLDEKGPQIVDTPGGAQTVTAVSEAGLYGAIMRRQAGYVDHPALRDQVKAFQRWVTHDVLPAIRKTGTYSNAPAPAVPDITTPVGVLAMAEQFAATARALVAAEAKVAELEPQAEAAQTLLSSDGDYSLREAAQILARDHGINTGQNRLLAHLRELEWVDMQGRPYQRQIDTGRIAVRSRSYEHPHTGEPTLSVQVRVTPKGLLYLHENWPRPAQLSVLKGGA